MELWNTGAGKQVEFKNVLEAVMDHSMRDGKVFIGTDSFVTKDKCIFATALCLHGAKEQQGGIYFFRRVKENKKRYTELGSRIMWEVQRSIDLGLLLHDFNSEIEIELHLDISPRESNFKTSRFADMMTGYARGAGFDFKIKPEAWASASVADKHSK